MGRTFSLEKYDFSQWIFFLFWAWKVPSRNRRKISLKNYRSFLSLRLESSIPQIIRNILFGKIEEIFSEWVLFIFRAWDWKLSQLVLKHTTYLSWDEPLHTGSYVSQNIIAKNQSLAEAFQGYLEDELRFIMRYLLYR